jgi:Helicase conserved C-terminal domain/Type III restriction enzyme, res subunit
MSTSSKGPVEKGLSLDFLDAKPEAVVPPKKRKTVKKKVEKDDTDETPKPNEKLPKCPKGEHRDRKTRKCVPNKTAEPKHATTSSGESFASYIASTIKPLFTIHPTVIDNKKTILENLGSAPLATSVESEPSTPFLESVLPFAPIVEPEPSTPFVKNVVAENVVAQPETIVAENVVAENVDKPQNPIPETQENPVGQIYDLENNADLLKKERQEYDNNRNALDEYDFLYPELDDPNFNVKIAKHKEFNDTKYDGTLHPIEQQADIMCNARFELLPHQLFVKNFMSLQTPYNSLLLYAGLGSGKTCSAIGIAEEMRAYMKQLNINKRILVVASPNVQSNFRLQLFDERRLQLIKSGDDGIWNIESCVGNSLLKEINPTNLKGLSKEKVVAAIKRIINANYLFLGYGQLNNFIYDALHPEEKKYKKGTRERVGDKSALTKKQLVSKIRELFDHRLIIIDEVHNIRISADNAEKKKTALLLMKVAKYAKNLRMLLLSATPLFNSYKEIIWLTNLMNVNDKRAIIETNDVFDTDGNFKEATADKEGGRELLMRKLTGYISYVRGENPYSFPMRIYPNQFASKYSITSIDYPTIQMNGTPVEEPIKHIPIYVNTIGSYQKKAYQYMIENMKEKSYDYYTKYGQYRNMPTFENMDSFGYTLLQNPLQSLNMVYPNDKLEVISDDIDPDALISSMIGEKGLSNTMNYSEKTENYLPMRYNFDYKPEILAKYGPIFKMTDEKGEPLLAKYSAKIAEICRCVLNSTGIIIIYTQYIDGGIVPLALALEELGFGRYSSSANAKNLFAGQRTEPLDALTMKPRSKLEEGFEFHQAKYVMITGDKAFSPNNAADIKQLTNPENKYGKDIKVVLLSKAGAEGLDFKNIRQVHVLEPWFNMNRIEQIIGRGVRNLSHCQLPFKERNVEIYLHGTHDADSEEEAADLYVYRLAEKKAVQIGNVTRVMKSVAVDCILNHGQTNFTQEMMGQEVEQTLASGQTIKLKAGDRPHTEICDYMDNCNMVCSPNVQVRSDEIITDNYSQNFVQMNQNMILQNIRNLFREKTTYERDALFAAINIVKQYPVEQIYYTLSYLINNKNEYLTDKYGRLGHLIDKYDPSSQKAYYYFQPVEITDTSISNDERSRPVTYPRKRFVMEIDKTIKPDDVVENNTANTNLIPNRNPVAILENIDAYISTIFNTTTIAKGEKSWYKHAGKTLFMMKNPENSVYQVLNDYQINDETIRKIMTDHILDTMSFDDKMALISYFYDKVDHPPSSNPYIKEYFENRRLNLFGKTCIILMKEDQLVVMVQEIRGDSRTWNEADSEDLEDLQDQVLNYRIPLIPQKTNSLVGFITLFVSPKSNTREMVFKIKDFDQKKNNIGARIDDAGKDKVIKLLNRMVGSPIYNDENTQNISQLGLCFILEVLMRIFTLTGRNEKTYFFSPEQTALSNVIKGSMQ